MDIEIWKNINSHYQMSSFGKIKSFMRNPQGKLIKAHFNADGYLFIGLRLPKRTTKGIHRLLAEVFLPNPNSLPEVNHINGIKTDNRLENLEWCTRQHNVIHAYKNKLNTTEMRRGSNHYHHKLTDEDVIELRQLHTMYGINATQTAKQYGITQVNLSYILSGKSWKHLL